MCRHQGVGQPPLFTNYILGLICHISVIVKPVIVDADPDQDPRQDSCHKHRNNTFGEIKHHHADDTAYYGDHDVRIHDLVFGFDLIRHFLSL